MLRPPAPWQGNTGDHTRVVHQCSRLLASRSHLPNHVHNLETMPNKMHKSYCPPCWTYGMLNCHMSKCECCLIHLASRSHVACRHCNYCSDITDPMTMINIPIVKTVPVPTRGRANGQTVHIRSVESALDMYCSEEKLCDHPCVSCGALDTSTRRLSFVHLPEVLILHLIRHDKQSKLRHTVAFQSQMSIKTHTNFKDNQMYDLYAVIGHTGATLKDGHYTAYCRDEFQPHIWRAFDDDTYLHTDLRRRCASHICSTSIRSVLPAPDQPSS